MTCVGLLAGSGLAAAAELPGRSGWQVGGTSPHEYEVRLDSTGGRDQTPCAVLRARVEETTGYVTLMQRAPAAPYRGRRVRMSAYVKTEGVEDWSGLWMRIDRTADGKALAFDNMQNRPIRGTTGWIEHAVVLDVPPEGGRLYFGIILSGRGKVWVDDFDFQVVGPEIPTTDLFGRRLAQPELGGPP